VKVVVVYIHGLWLGGAEAMLLRRRLSRELGAEALAFAYPSVAADSKTNAMALGRYLQKIQADSMHLVAHSLGGLLVLAVPALTLAALPPGRIVFLGSPVRGSVSARRLVRLPLGGAMLGASGGELLLGARAPRWQGPRELGVIAGDLPLGLGRLLGRMDDPNDGTVLVDETDLPGATARLRLRVSHSGMPFSAGVARQTAAFLRDGRFVG
jgi:hypothetical protein